VVDDGMTGSSRESTPSSSWRSVVEVVSRGEPRRRWSDEERAPILAEAMAPGAIPSHVARRFGVSTGQFYTWRKAMLLRSAPVGVSPMLANADVTEVRLSAPTPKPTTPSPIPATGMMEITLPLRRVPGRIGGGSKSSKPSGLKCRCSRAVGYAISFSSRSLRFRQSGNT
jgi:transposase